MNNKIYSLYGIDTAIKLLRPNARWEIINNKFSLWDDPRPCPTWEEIMDTMDKIKKFEDSINTIWLDEDIQKFNEHIEIIEKDY